MSRKIDVWMQNNKPLTNGTFFPAELDDSALLAVSRQFDSLEHLHELSGKADGQLPDCVFLTTDLLSGQFEKDIFTILSSGIQCYFVVGDFPSHQVCQIEQQYLHLVPCDHSYNDWLDLLLWLQSSLNKGYQGNGIATDNYSKVIPVRSVGRIKLVAVDDIMWIQGAANYVELHLANQMLLHRDTMSSLERRLNSDKFIRIHRSTIVNLDYVREISSELGRYTLVEMNNGKELKIGNAYRKSLFNALGIDAAS
ncbi:hypothetical protein CWI84_06255 [Idiomarina tyrosinivorans]|uniref:HTH LytTR-type domain-containing protein n=1 Tax=Idiomarina tyrosinivorans TaxID=1445662 RepID=A0A432ZQQ4_9GAMM|nr:LytTR family DNA-binding domain-containing protein [Idiomarina tyrosinivorans]RUO80230.1 hypothetical protein CWI84_06255 [Idiomarina tyrosinivorans]